jgi:hypothetical protein
MVYPRRRTVCRFPHSASVALGVEGVMEGGSVFCLRCRLFILYQNLLNLE